MQWPFPCLQYLIFSQLFRKFEARMSKRKDSYKHERRNRVEEPTRTTWGNVAAEEEEENQAKRAREAEPKIVKEKANFGLTGNLAKDEVTGNMYNGVLLKWSEPADAASPTKRWKLFVFKEDKIIDTLHLHRQSAYLVGRDNRVADILVAHESISKQHCVIQYRKIETTTTVFDKDGNEIPKTTRTVKPYIMDLASANKTLVNGEALDDARYYELKEKDGIRFGMSSREYVLMCDN